MSLVTNVLLIGDYKGVKALNEGFIKQLDTHAFTRVSDCAGNKWLECDIYPGAFNHLNLAELVNAIDSAPWECPECVQLLVKEENDMRFREVELGISRERRRTINRN